MENKPPVIYESFERDFGYEYGIGLRTIVQADEINREVIYSIIDRFLQVGETDLHSAQPVPREVLPFETQTTALSKIKYSI